MKEKRMKLCLHHLMCTWLMLLQPTIAFHTVKILNPSLHRNIQWTRLFMSCSDSTIHRRSFLTGITTVLCSTTIERPAHALVKGNAPPPPKKGGDERKCRNVGECQEMAERTASQQEEIMKSQMLPPKVTALGTRYRDMDPETSIDVQLEPDRLVKAGNTVSIRYKVLKLGKRSYDGLIGEGTVIFSRG